MRLALFGLAVLTAFSLPAAASAAGQGGIGARLIATPGVSSRNPIARISILATLLPGATLTRTVEVSNTTDSAAAVTVYPAAASNLSGRFAFAPGRTQNELSGWMRVSEPALRLSPGGRAIETVTIAVPPGAADGELAAIVWTEIRSLATSGVELVNRVGVRVYLTVGAGGFETIAPTRPHRIASTSPPIAPSAVGQSFWSAQLLRILASVGLLLGGVAVALTGSAVLRGRRGVHGPT